MTSHIDWKLILERQYVGNNKSGVSISLDPLEDEDDQSNELNSFVLFVMSSEGYNDPGGYIGDEWGVDTSHDNRLFIDGVDII